MPKIGERFRNGWNAFLGRDPTYKNFQYGMSFRPDRMQYSRNNIRTSVSAIYNRIAVDVASMNFAHVQLDDDGQYKETIESDLNNALTLEANLDQTGRMLIQDAVESMFDEGCVAIVPVDTDINPMNSEAFKIYTLRVAKILEWYPYEIRVDIYNERRGVHEKIVVDKRYAAIVENPFYAIMNEPNSLLQRLIRALNQLDRVNEQSSAGKMDMIIQLPYSIKSKAREIQAEQKRKTLEHQLTESQYGIGYIDATEKITQLNRPLENNLWIQVKELKDELYNQLGLTKEIFDGTADEQVLLNYNNRTVVPVVSALTEEMQRKWLSKNARTRGQAIRAFNDPFKFIPVNQIAEFADKFTRNEIMSSNEVRAAIGLKPSDDPRASQLINSNLNHPDEGGTPVADEEETDIDISNILEE